MRSRLENCLSLSIITTLIVALSLPGGAQQQGQPSSAQGSLPSAPKKSKPDVGGDPTDYSRPRSQVPNLLGAYQGRDVPEPLFANTPRIDRLIQDGKLMLSLSDAIALALENNLDLAIARYNLPIADTDILRAKSGNSIRGVATGLVQGTPGGGVGTIGATTQGATGAQGAAPGGTTAAAGGAATGTSGLVQSTLGVGPATPSFDPIVTSTLSIEHASIPLSNAVTTGTLSLQQNTGTANFEYAQGFATGTAMTVDFNNARQSTNALFAAISPQISSNFRLTLRQHLLQGLGLATNTRFIRIARNNREISDVAFRQQVITSVSQIQNIYWDLVNAYEDVKVKERSLALSNKTLSDNRKQVQIGTLAPIEIVRAEAQVATDNQNLIVSQTNLQLQQLLIKNALSRNLTDPVLAAAQVVPTDKMQLPAVEPVVPIQDMIADALSHRAELAQARIDLTNRDLTKKSARNALLPTLDLVGWYGGAGLAGVQNPLNTLGVPPGTALPIGGFSDAFGNLFNSSSPDYAVGFSVNIPLRNRGAQADQARAELEYRQAQLRLQQLENQVGIEVRNAQFTLQQDRARVDAAGKAQELAQQTLDAEQKKYALGASTTFLVLQAQRDLAQAESNRLTAMSSYEKDRVELDRVTGNTLTSNGIQMDDAESGTVKTQPAVPGVAPRTDLTMAPGQPNATPQAPPTAPSQTAPPNAMPQPLSPQ